MTSSCRLICRVSPDGSNAASSASSAAGGNAGIAASGTAHRRASSAVIQSTRISKSSIDGPSTSITSSRNDSFGEVVELPFGGDLTINDARIVHGGLVVKFDPVEKLVNCEQGAILDPL